MLHFASSPHLHQNSDTPSDDMSSAVDELSVQPKQVSVSAQKHKGALSKRSKGPLDARFKLSFATGTRVLKGEDVLFIEPLPMYPESQMFLVADGHSGAEAANFVCANFYDILCSKLITLPPSLPDIDATLEVETFAEELRRVMCETFVRIENSWTELGHMAGTTVTVVLVMDYLMTVANTGDSEGVLDTGCSILELTESHRLQTHEKERQRLKAAGCRIAQLGFHLQGPAKPGEPGVGPLRIWPGGLCVSRSIGDMDAGPEVVPFPHVKQLILPEPGCRFIISSDGLWDVLTLSKAVKLVRSKPTAAAASALIEAVLRDQRFMDDTTVIVVDVLPPHAASFPAVALQAGLDPLIQAQRSKQSRSGGLCACFSGAAEPEPDSRDMEGSGPGRLKFIADVDCLVAYPSLRERLMRNSLVPGERSKRTKEPDFTVHAMRNFYPSASGGALRGAGSGNVSMHGSGGLEHSRSRLDHPLTPAASLEEGEPDADVSMGRAESGTGGRGMVFPAAAADKDVTARSGGPGPYEGSQDERVRNAKSYQALKGPSSRGSAALSALRAAEGGGSGGPRSWGSQDVVLAANGSGQHGHGASSTSGVPSKAEGAAGGATAAASAGS